MPLKLSVILSTFCLLLAAEDTYQHGMKEAGRTERRATVPAESKKADDTPTRFLSCSVFINKKEVDKALFKSTAGGEGETERIIKEGEGSFVNFHWDRDENTHLKFDTWIITQRNDMPDNKKKGNDAFFISSIDLNGKDLVDIETHFADVDRVRNNMGQLEKMGISYSQILHADLPSGEEIIFRCIVLNKKAFKEELKKQLAELEGLLNLIEDPKTREKAIKTRFSALEYYMSFVNDEAKKETGPFGGGYKSVQRAWRGIQGLIDPSTNPGISAEQNVKDVIANIRAANLELK